MKTLCLLFFVVAIGGIVYGEDIFSLCEKQSGGLHFTYTNVPTEEEIAEKCPGEIEYFRCFYEKMKEEEDDSGVLTDMTKKMYEFFKDMCDPDSENHKAFIASLGCYKSLEDEGRECFSKAKDVYKTFHSLIGHEEPEDVDSEWTEIEAMCMVQSVNVACLSDKVMKNCGAEAYETMIGMVSRSQYLRRYCSPEKKEIFKTSLLDNLKLDEETENVYRRLFEIIKKK